MNLMKLSTVAQLSNEELLTKVKHLAERGLKLSRSYRIGAWTSSVHKRKIGK